MNAAMSPELQESRTDWQFGNPSYKKAFAALGANTF